MPGYVILIIPRFFLVLSSMFMDLIWASLLVPDLNPPLEHIVFFDGCCHLCNSSVKWLIRLDKKRILKYAPLQGESAGLILKTETSTLPESIVYLRKGKAHVKSSASIWLLYDVAWYFKWIVLFFVIPGFIRNGLYDFIAKNRYRWFGKYDTCAKPQPEWTELFLP